MSGPFRLAAAGYGALEGTTSAEGLTTYVFENTPAATGYQAGTRLVTTTYTPQSGGLFDNILGGLSRFFNIKVPSVVRAPAAAAGAVATTEAVVAPAPVEAAIATTERDEAMGALRSLWREYYRARNNPFTASQQLERATVPGVV